MTLKAQMSLKVQTTESS